jgi:hypothetical protein
VAATRWQGYIVFWFTIDEAVMIITALRAAAAIAIIGVCGAAAAPLIPPNELPGRERERFTNPQPPRSQLGGSIFLPGPASRGGKPHAHKPRTPKK